MNMQNIGWGSTMLSTLLHTRRVPVPSPTENSFSCLKAAGRTFPPILVFATLVREQADSAPFPWVQWTGTE